MTEIRNLLESRCWKTDLQTMKSKGKTRREADVKISIRVISCYRVYAVEPEQFSGIQQEIFLEVSVFGGVAPPVWADLVHTAAVSWQVGRWPGSYTRASGWISWLWSMRPLFLHRTSQETFSGSRNPRQNKRTQVLWRPALWEAHLHCHLHHILLAQSHHKNTQNSRGQVTDFISCWDEVQSPIAEEIYRAGPSG